MTTPSTISERSEKALLALFPRAVGRSDAASFLVDALVEAELHRTGRPDAVTGAFHALALTQGTLLKEEYDLSTHGHADGWVMGAVVVDPVAFTLFNMRYGFEAGHAALRAMVDAMKAACATAKVVRIHTDGLAMLLGPTADRRVDAELVARVRTGLEKAMAAVTPADDSAPLRVEFTVGGLELTVVDPPNWQLLGPLVWAECERAIVIAKRAPWSDVLRRETKLNGRLPDFTSR
ncbi:MAG: GGDEF domain-containing protein [Archangium sp.]|nr:GGDEF domain-containing protein [Archangium sp.]